MATLRHIVNRLGRKGVITSMEYKAVRNNAINADRMDLYIPDIPLNWLFDLVQYTTSSRGGLRCIDVDDDIGCKVIQDFLKSISHTSPIQ